MKFSDLIEIRKNRPLIAAHRGAIGVNVPCNTLEAFQVALNQGADIIELDITKSIDGELFVFHPYMDFPHLGKLLPMQLKHSSVIKKYCYRNVDFVKTPYKVSTFDEALDFLKSKCIINIDKFWSCPEIIVNKLKRHDMLDAVIVKSYFNNKTISTIKELCPNIPYMLMMRQYIPEVESLLKNKDINLIAEELIFNSIESDLISEPRIDFLHRNDIYAWCNSIVYNYKDVIAADKTDDRSVVGNQENTWGWLVNRGFDIIQTDWVRELSLYLKNK